MAELLLSEITRMNDGFCVIGLERSAGIFVRFGHCRGADMRGGAFRIGALTR